MPCKNTKNGLNKPILMALKKYQNIKKSVDKVYFLVYNKQR